MVKKISIGLLITLVVIQFISLDKNEASTRELSNFIEETKPSSEVLTILEKNCFDCHTNQTSYPWYAQIAPVSFWINHHVEEGKEHLDFSNWANYKAKRKKHKLDEVIEEVEEGEMPLKTYELLHGDLNEAETEVLISWAKQVINLY